MAVAFCEHVPLPGVPCIGYFQRLVHAAARLPSVCLKAHFVRLMCVSVCSLIGSVGWSVYALLPGQSGSIRLCVCFVLLRAALGC